MRPRPTGRIVSLLCLLLAGGGGALFRVLQVAAAQENPPNPRGGDIVPLRQVSDPYPVFNGIAVDPVNNVVVMSDVNKKSVLSYDRTTDSSRSGITPPRRQVFGPLTNIGFIAGVAVDPQRRELFAVNNDIEDTMVVLPYDAGGNAAPSRIVSIPHHSLRRWEACCS